MLVHHPYYTMHQTVLMYLLLPEFHTNQYGVVGYHSTNLR